MSAESDAVGALEQLGLTEYEARCFVALAQIGQGTAKEVSTVSDVPRSRVYDTIGRLHRDGLVDVQESDPKEYRPVSFDDALTSLQREYESYVEEARDAMTRIESVEADDDEGIWAVESKEHVVSRITSLCDEATERIHAVVTVAGVVDDEILDCFAAATDRGVSVVVETPTAEVRDRVQEAVPGAKVLLFEDLDHTDPIEGKRPGQLLTIDSHAIVATGIEPSDLPKTVRETAVWSSGKDHGFATWIHELLTDRIEK